jgi:hypothetical protein
MRERAAARSRNSGQAIPAHEAVWVDRVGLARVSGGNRSECLDRVGVFDNPADAGIGAELHPHPAMVDLIAVGFVREAEAEQVRVAAEGHLWRQVGASTRPEVGSGRSDLGAGRQNVGPGSNAARAEPGRCVHSPEIEARAGADGRIGIDVPTGHSAGAGRTGHHIHVDAVDVVRDRDVDRAAPEDRRHAGVASGDRRLGHVFVGVFDDAADARIGAECHPDPAVMDLIAVGLVRKPETEQVRVAVEGHLWRYVGGSTRPEVESGRPDLAAGRKNVGSGSDAACAQPGR